MVLRDAAGRLGGRWGRVPGAGGPHRLPPLAAARHAAAAGVARPAAPRVGSRHRGRRQRRHPMDRRRFPHLPARRVRQVRPAGVGRRPAGAPGGLHAQHPGNAAAGHRRAGRDGDAAHGAADPWHNHRAGRHGAHAVLRGRGTAGSPGVVGDRWHRCRHHAGPRRALPAESGALLPRPVGRPHGQGLPEHPSPGGCGLGRVLRPRAGGQPGEVGVPSLRPHRLHLRHHRRGAGTGGRHRGRRAVRAAGDHRRPRRLARARPVRVASRHWCDGLVRRAGVRQHRCRAGHPPDHRGPASVRERRGFVAPVHDGRRRAVALGRTPGAGHEPAPARPVSGRG